VTTHHPWFTVSGGSKSYRDKLLSKFDPVRLPEKVVAVRGGAEGVEVATEAGGTFRFDRVVIAAHADEALAILPDAETEQRELLGAFPYQRNTAVLHTDESVMPRRKMAWASWNYRVSKAKGGGTQATTHYWMNALQGVSK
jgi:predicted NAD/FAD-binding protein